MALYPRNSAPWFSFLVHPRSVEDAWRAGPGRFLRDWSADDEEFRARLHTIPPLVLAEVRFGFRSIWGELVSVSRLPDELLGPDGARAVEEATRLAVHRGTRVVGLGALTSPATGGGLTLLPKMPPRVVLTNGNAYTAAVVQANVEEAADHLGLGSRATVAVVGCTGSVGTAASCLLAGAGFSLTLIGRSARRAEHLLAPLLGPLAEGVTFSGAIESARDADIVVLLTSEPGSRLSPDMPRAGSVVIDFAQPASLGAADEAALARRGVATAVGGIVEIPGYACEHELIVGEPASTFACLAETYLFARLGCPEPSVGRPSAERAQLFAHAARKEGIRLRPLGLGRRGTLSLTAFKTESKAESMTATLATGEPCHASDL